MDGEIRNTFKQITSKKPEKALSDRLILHLGVFIEKRRINRRITFTSLGAFGIIASAPALYYSGSALIQSEFFQYLSLLLSDGKMVLSNIGDYAQIMLESVPFMSMLGLFVGILVAIISIRISLIQIYGQRKLIQI
ncbi:MAG: hypothetical protein NTV72_03410 [Candidatus Taylorbacteria bacterium]|nr:hypothetical protein [Candidatus Taylorbacteria bacterium]